MPVSSDIMKYARRSATGRGLSLGAAVTAMLLLTGATAAQAQEGGGSREQLDRVLAVLRLQQASASKACLSAMSQVHATELQVKDHENDTGNHPDLDIAHDVLDSDYQNGTVFCGADADRACRQPHDASLIKACAALHHDPS